MSHDHGPARLALGLAALTAAAVLLLAEDAARQARRRERAEEFQRLVGGLGFGPATVLGRAPFRFDPRLGRGDIADLDPGPDGVGLAPHGTFSIFYYPARPRGRSEATGGVPDARTP
jgi:hypothetical protein